MKICIAFKLSLKDDIASDSVSQNIFMLYSHSMNTISVFIYLHLKEVQLHQVSI